jgi:HD-GYP domain-containing protein (c-di-GMP phosphodiesterase class II)
VKDLQVLVDSLYRKETELCNYLTKEQVLDHVTNLEYDILESVSLIEEKDHDPYRHGDQIVSYVKNISKYFLLPPEEVELISFASKLHDIGKKEVNKSILNKPGKLTDEEYCLIKRHSVDGEHIVSPFTYIGKLIRHHHERYDGKGYPDGLAGENIPMGSRIIAVIDSYNAMTHDRPYHTAIPKDEAIQELVRCSWSQFDPKVVNAFISFVREKINRTNNSQNN